jgi:hypothetical protein
MRSNSRQARNSVTAVPLLVLLYSLIATDAQADGDYQLGRGIDLGPLNFAGYADLVVKVPEHEKTSLVLNDLSLFVTGHFDRFFNPFTEVELADVEFLNRHSELAPEGGGNLALERLYNDSYLTGSVTLRLGKMLSPVGEWNVIHAAPLVLSETRPAVTYRDFSEYASGVSVIYSDPAGRLPDIQIYWQPTGELTERPRRLTVHQYQTVEGVHVNFSYGLLDRMGLSFQHSRDVLGTEQTLFGGDYHYTAGKLTFQGEATFSHLSGVSGSQRRNSEWAAYAAISYAVDESWSAYAWYEAFMDRAAPSTAQDLLFGIAFRFQPELVARLEYVQNIGGQPVNRTGVLASLSVLF